MSIVAEVRRRIRERADELRRARESGRGWWAAARALFVDLEEEVEAEVERRRQEDVDRALRDPFRFDERTDDFRAFRRRHGRRTPRRYRR